MWWLPPPSVVHVSACAVAIACETRPSTPRPAAISVRVTRMWPISRASSSDALASPVGSVSDASAPGGKHANVVVTPQS